MISNYPKGFPRGLIARGIPILQNHTGEVFWVGDSPNALLDHESAESDSNRGTFLQPFTTIAKALTLCTADRGDIIFVKPGHSEAISTADIDINVAGVTIIGLGTGTNRPTITYTGTTDTTTFDISADNVKVFNFLFTSTDNTGVDDAVIINGTDCELAFCEFRSDSDDFFDAMLTIGKVDADSNRAWVHDNKFITTAGVGVNRGISFEGDMEDVVIEDNWMDGDFADSGIEIPTAGDAQVNLKVRRNYVRNRQTGDHAIQIAAITSGSFEHNTLVGDTLTAIISQVANAVYVDNKGSLANAATTGPVGGSFYVPANLYPDQKLITRQQTGSMASGYGPCDDPTEFTVSGVVKVWDCFGVVTTAVTSTCSTGTIQLGVADDTDLFCGAVTANGTNLAQHDIWAVTTTTVNGDRAIGSGAPAYIANGVDIKSYIATNAMTAGAMDLYITWTPVTHDGNIVAAG